MATDGRLQILRIVQQPAQLRSVNWLVVTADSNPEESDQKPARLKFPIWSQSEMLSAANNVSVTVEDGHSNTTLTSDFPSLGTRTVCPPRWGFHAKQGIKSSLATQNFKWNLTRRDHNRSRQLSFV